MSAEEEVASLFNTLRGRCLGTIESWGLPNVFGDEGQRQEDGIKAILKTLTYDIEAQVKALVSE